MEPDSEIAPKFDANGLVTAIVSDSTTGELLMVAHMNAEALERTIKTGQSHFWSRSRQELWHKGATSGNLQNVQEIRVDCDQDAIWLKVQVEGGASCHTGRTSCFFRRVEAKDGEFVLITDPPQ